MKHIKFAILLITTVALSLLLSNCHLLYQEKGVEGSIKDLQTDSNPYNRWRAANTLGKLKDQRAIEPLIAALSDRGEFMHPSPALRGHKGRVQDAVACSLGEFGISVVERLISILEKSNDPFVRAGAINALARINDNRVVEPLISALKDDNDSSVRSEAASKLSWVWRDIKDSRIIEALKLATTDSGSNVAWSAKFSIEEIEKESSSNNKGR